MRIFIADGQAKVRSALRLMLEHNPGTSVVGEVARAADLPDQVMACCPDVLLLDWELPGFNVGLLSIMRSTCPGVQIVAISSKPETCQKIQDAGADGFISKGESPARLLDVLANCNKTITSAI